VKAGSNGKLAIIGRDMQNRVTPVAKGLSAETLETWGNSTPALRKEWKAATREWDELKSYYAARGTKIPDSVVEDDSLIYKMNKAWIRHLKDEGYTVLDLGGGPGSVSYDMEVNLVHGK